MSSAVATAFRVTPAQATSASSSMSPEHAEAVAAGRRMQPGLDQGAAGLDLAGNPCRRAAHRFQGDECGPGAVRGTWSLMRSLKGSQRAGVHGVVLGGAGSCPVLRMGLARLGAAGRSGRLRRDFV